jgi:hypothetical protein
MARNGGGTEGLCSHACSPPCRKEPRYRLAWPNEKKLCCPRRPGWTKIYWQTRHFNPQTYGYWILASSHDLFHYAASIALPEASPPKRHDIGYLVYDTISHLRVSLTEMASTPEPLIFFHIKAKLKAFSFPEPPPPHQKRARNYCSNDSGDGAAEERSRSA